MCMMIGNSYVVSNMSSAGGAGAGPAAAGPKLSNPTRTVWTQPAMECVLCSQVIK